MFVFARFARYFSRLLIVGFGVDAVEGHVLLHFYPRLSHLSYQINRTINILSIGRKNETLK